MNALASAGSLACLALSLGIAALSSGAQPPAEERHATTDTVTVQAARERKELEREVSHFVFAVSVRYLNDALSRWNRPICPLVAGLPREQGEYILARLSQIATQAKAPLAGEHCKKANFYVVVTREPDVLLKAWHARDPSMYMTRNGGGYIRNFLDTPRPVRIWYNTDFVSLDGTALSANSVAAALNGAAGTAGTGLAMQLAMANIPSNTVPTGTRLRRGAVQTLSSVIVVVDASRVADLHLAQLADYIGMVGLAEVNLDADVGSAPSIMKLFRDIPDPPQGLSSFDQAFLAALYRADQSSVMQESTMKRIMLESIAPQHTAQTH